MLFWIVEEWNDTGPSALPALLLAWGYWKCCPKKLSMVLPFLDLLVSHVFILTKACLLFPYFYVNGWSGEVELGREYEGTHSCTASVARSKIGSIEIILIFTSWSSKCTCDGWWVWTPLLSNTLSLLFYSLSLSSFFWVMLSWQAVFSLSLLWILGREESSINILEYLFCRVRHLTSVTEV